MFDTKLLSLSSRLVRYSFFVCVGLTIMSPQIAVSQESAPMPTSSMPPGRGNSFNPEISANGLILYQNRGANSPTESVEPNGLSLQEFELQFVADVDPYSRFFALLSLHPETSFNATENKLETEYHFDPEEIFAESIAIPRMIAKAGKFRASFGRQNLLHTHALPFIDEALFQTALLGEEGLNDLGVSLAALIPAPWFSEVTVQALQGDAEGVSYLNSNTSNDHAYLARLRNLWDLSPSATIELGVSGLTGGNRFDEKSELLGVDLTYKWRPVEGGRDTAVIFSAEAVSRTIDAAAAGEAKASGLSTWVQYQFARRWWVQGRMEWLHSELTDGAAPELSEINGELAARQNRWSALVGFVPSEFSAFRVQYDQTTVPGSETEHRVLAQLNFSIGAHPAHAY